jgi:hypothetical protein
MKCSDGRRLKGVPALGCKLSVFALEVHLPSSTNSPVPTALSFSLRKCIALEIGDEDVTSVLHPTKARHINLKKS